MHSLSPSKMEDIVALRVVLSSGEARFFLTWGRVAGTANLEPLEALLWQSLHMFSLGGTPVDVKACDTLQEAAAAPYFFEAFFALCQERIPFGDEYEAWAARKRTAMQAGKEFHYLGANAT